MVEDEMTARHGHQLEEQRGRDARGSGWPGEGIVVPVKGLLHLDTWVPVEGERNHLVDESVAHHWSEQHDDRDRVSLRVREGHGAAREACLADGIGEGALQREARGARWIAGDFHVAPGHRAGPARAESLQRRLSRREPRREVRPRARLRPAVRQLRPAERLREEVVATVEARPEGRDVDEIDADPHGALVRTTPPGPPGRGGPSRASGRYRGSSAASGSSPPPWAAR